MEANFMFVKVLHKMGKINFFLNQKTEERLERRDGSKQNVNVGKT